MAATDRPTILTPSMARMLRHILEHTPGIAVPRVIERADDLDVDGALLAIAEGKTVVVLAP